MQSTLPKARWRRLADWPKPVRALLWALLAVVAWLCLITEAHVSSSIDLDPSWQHAYSWFFSHGMQAGIDYVFTYGPWSFLEYGTYQPGVFWQRVILWELLAKLAVAIAFLVALRRMSNWTDRVVLAVLMLLVAYWDSRTSAFALLLGALLLTQPRIGWGALTAVSALLGLFAWLKFTNFLQVAMVMACVVAGRGLAFGWRDGLRCAGVFTLGLLGLWVAAGQHPLHLPQFLAASLQIAGGYGSAMSIPAPRGLVLHAMALLGVAAALACVHALRRPRSPQSLAIAVAFFGTCVLAYKASYIRHGGASNFFVTAALAAFLLLRTPRDASAVLASPWGARSEAALRYALLLLSVPGMQDQLPLPPPAAAAHLRQAVTQHIDRARRYAHPFRMEADLRRQYGFAERAFHMPHSVREIGSSSVDIVPVEAGLVILNGLNWHPRPVFQSYSAYTSALFELNRRFYAGDDAPQYVWLRPNALDQRFSPGEDGPVQQLLLRRYEPVLLELEFLLLRRKAEEPEPPEREIVLETTLGRGEVLDLRGIEGESLVLELDVQPSFATRLRTLLYQAQPLWLEFQFEGSPDWHKSRLVPAALQAGTLVRPFLQSNDQWIGWYAGEPTQAIAAVRVSNASLQLLEGTPKARVLRARDLVQPPPSDARSRLNMHWFDVEQMSKEGPHPLCQLDSWGLRVTMVHPPARLAFPTPAGPQVLRGTIGMMAECYPHSDGVLLELGVQDAAGNVRHITERLLDPRNITTDRGPIAFQVVVDVPQGGSILLSVTPGPAGDENSDWFWIYGLTIQPVEPQK